MSRLTALAIISYALASIHSLFAAALAIADKPGYAAAVGGCALLYGISGIAMAADGKEVK